MFINTGCLAAWTRRVVPTLKDITDKVISVALANTYKIPVPIDTERDGSRARYTFFYELVYIGQHSDNWWSGDCDVMLSMMLYY